MTHTQTRERYELALELMKTVYEDVTVGEDTSDPEQSGFIKVEAGGWVVRYDGTFFYSSFLGEPSLPDATLTELAWAFFNYNMSLGQENRNAALLSTVS